MQQRGKHGSWCIWDMAKVEMIWSTILYIGGVWDIYCRYLLDVGIVPSGVSSRRQPMEEGFEEMNGVEL